MESSHSQPPAEEERSEQSATESEPQAARVQTPSERESALAEVERIQNLFPKTPRSTARGWS